MAKAKPNYVAVYRVFFHDDSEVAAVLTSDHLREHIKDTLDPGDYVECTDAVPMNTTQLRPLELVMLLRKCRNALIRTKMKDCYDTARQLDQFAHAFYNMSLEPGVDGPPYEYGNFLPIVERILAGQEPLD